MKTIAPIASTEGAILGTIVCWSTSGTVSPETLEDSLDDAMIGDFLLPSVMTAASQFKHIMRSFSQVRYQNGAATHERALLQHPLTKGRNPDVIVHTSNLAVKSGKRENTLCQVGSIEFDTTLCTITPTVFDDPQILPEDVARFNRMVDTIEGAYRAIKNKLTYAEINQALTDYLFGCTGAVKVVKTSQNWFVPNIPTLGERNPHTRVNALLEVLDSTIKGMELFRFDIMSTGCHMTQMSKAAKSKVAAGFEALEADLEKVGINGKMQDRRRRRLLSECAEIGHCLTVYEALLSTEYIAETKREIAAFRTMINMRK